MQDALFICASQYLSTTTSVFTSRLAYGNFEEFPANSCLDIRDHRPSTPPSGAYYMNITDPCTMESNIIKVRRAQEVGDLEFTCINSIAY